MRVANYECSEIIGSGAFGVIYKGKNVRTGEPVVLKTERLDISYSSIKHESNILNILYSKSCRSIPPIYWYGILEDQRIRLLVMPFYNESLETVRIENEKMMLNIIRSAITIVNHIHDNYVVHRDIKPANFMIHNDELILIDFGLASFYVDSEEKHISPANPKKTHIIGTPKYVSWNVHCGEEYSRRDDLLSIVYIGLFLVYGKDLWTDLPPFLSEEEKSSTTHPRNQWFKQQKDIHTINRTIMKMPCVDLGFVDRMTRFAEHVYSLSFQERPSYKLYLELFTKTI